MLKDILDEKKCFKLICGAGNENFQEIEKLVALYSLAGCKLFDVNASVKAVEAAQRGLDFAIPKEAQKHYNICISVGTKNDAHLNKAKINQKQCIKCGNCIKICPQGAITKDFQVDEEKCIGCLKCLNKCCTGAIEIYAKNKPIEEILEEIAKTKNGVISPSLLAKEGWGEVFKRTNQQNNKNVNGGLNISPSPLAGEGRGEGYRLSFSKYKTLTNIELHTTGENPDETRKDWEFLSKNFDGMLSLCVGREKVGNENILTLIKTLVSMRKPYSTIIQTDGSPMSGGKDDYKTTLQAIAMAELVRNADLPVYILPSGGTNSKTAELARICDVDINGVAIGSYARKIVKEYVDREDFLTNKAIFDKAFKIAQNLVNSL